MFSLPAYISSRDLFDVPPAVVHPYVPSTRLSSIPSSPFCNLPNPPSTPSHPLLPLHLNTLLYRRFVHSQQPCFVCDRPISVFQPTAIAPCGHLQHFNCLEEAVRRGDKCVRCQTEEAGYIEKALVYACCLQRYQ